MIALKTSPLLFEHEILLVFHLFLYFVLIPWHTMYADSSILRRYYILSILFVIALPLSIVHGKKLEFSGFFIMSSFLLCDTLSGYLERPNNSDSNISHCCHWRHVYSLVALVCNSCAELTVLILNVWKYSDKGVVESIKNHPFLLF